MQPMTTAFVFPGQGAQTLKMMDAYGDHPAITAVFNQAKTVLNLDFLQLLQAETPDLINETHITQPLMLTAGVAVYQAWLASGGDRPHYFAGHSLGEYTALVCAGSLPFDVALQLVTLRATAMQAAVPVGVGAMAAILGLPLPTIEALCAANRALGVVQAVNLNEPNQTVIAGNKEAVAQTMTDCLAQGAKRALSLPVSVPSHCDLMRPAADQLALALTNITLMPSHTPVIHNADVASYDTADAIKTSLTKQLYSPVRWTETIQHFEQLGVTRIIECGPSKVLTGLNKRIAPNIDSTSLHTIEQITQCIA